MKSKRQVVVPLQSDDPAELDQIIEDALSAVGNEAKRLATKSRTEPLLPEEAKALNEYIRSMVLLKKDARSAEQLAKGGLEQLSDEELQAELQRLSNAS